MNIYLSVSYCELALPLSSLSWPTTGLSWYQTSLSLVVPSVLPLILLCFLILFVAKYIGNMKADIIHALR